MFNYSILDSETVEIEFNLKLLF